MNFLTALSAGVLGIFPVFFFKKLEKDTKCMFGIIWGIFYIILGWIFISVFKIPFFLLLVVWWVITCIILSADKV